MTEIALQTWDLGVGYRTRRTRRIVLEGLNLSVHRSELVCLLGPNGVGKSTLLRTIARMQPPLSGGLELGGMDQRLMTETELARRLGAVLTERVTVESLPARRIVELGRYPHSGWFGALTDRDRGVVDWALTSVNAQRLAAQDFSRLSDGERQRIMIARALAQEPVILVLDEPTAFLDAPSRVEIIRLLKRLARDQGVAIILSTHDLDLALRNADVIWLVSPGGELFVGTPEDVVLGTDGGLTWKES